MAPLRGVPEPQDRPRDAGVLAERISTYLQSVETKFRETEMEGAAQAARLELQQRSARRMRKLIAGLAVVALFAVVACAAALVANQKANREREAAQLAEQRAMHSEAEPPRTVRLRSATT